MIRFLIAYVVAVMLVGIAAGWGYYTYFRGGEPVRFVLPDQTSSTEGAGADTSSDSAITSGNSGGDRMVARAPAEPPSRTFEPSPLPLALPIACDPGVDCWIINYVDADPGPGRADFACGDMSYDKHKGTDFALANDARLADDVAVLVAAPGRVVGARDAMPDVGVRDGGKEAIAGKECGNGVRVDHGDGWTTQYCHLKRGSIRVRSGDVLRTGERLGSVGLSGLTEFPHLHMTVEKDGRVVDPFVGLSGGPRCDVGDAPLWRPEVLSRLDYTSPKLFHVGFVDRQLSTDESRTGAHTRQTIATDAPVMILFMEAAGIRPGDFLSMTIWGPDNTEVVSTTHRFDQTRIVARRFVGKKAKGSWVPGIYRGVVRIIREGPDGPREVRHLARIEVR
jgi:murein DD-endopeptidase MepM/ murein hydrolase activator NlpD